MIGSGQNLGYESMYSLLLCMDYMLSGLEGHIGLDEQAATFLYMFLTSLLIRHVGERFQNSNKIISK